MKISLLFFYLFFEIELRSELCRNFANIFSSVYRILIFEPSFSSSTLLFTLVNLTLMNLLFYNTRKLRILYHILEDLYFIKYINHRLRVFYKI